MKKFFVLLAVAMTINFASAQDLALNQTAAFDMKGINFNSKQVALIENSPTVNLFAFFNENDQNVSSQNNENGTNEMGRKKYKGQYFMLGSGFGPSYGGFGIKAQFRFPLTKTQGIGVHAGVGAFPFAPILGNVGVKYFPYKDIYINAQFGLNGIELYETYDFLAGKTLYGPSLLIGGDWTWGKKVGVGINAAVGASYYINAVNFFHFFPTMDLGFIVRI